MNHFAHIHIQLDLIRIFSTFFSLPPRCTICQYHCTSKASLDKHVHLVHKKERPFACQVCQRRFGQKVHLNVVRK